MQKLILTIALAILTSFEATMAQDKLSQPLTITVSAASGNPNLSWTAGTSPACSSSVKTACEAGYNVYRSTVSGGPYAKIVSGVTVLTYTDTTAPQGSVFYVATTVDSMGDESVYSNEASTTVGLKGNWFKKLWSKIAGRK